MMKISELSRVSDIPVSTIRYYMLEGLMPEPVKAGKTMAYYSDDHVNRLVLIKKMKSDNLPVKAMKEIIGQQQDLSLPKPYDLSMIKDGKRDSIIRAGVSVFREKGYSDTTITDIVEKAGIGRNTFYGHFKNKEELFLECADHIFDNLDELVDDVEHENDLNLRIRKRLAHVFNNPQLIDMLNLIRGTAINNPAFKEKLVDVVRAYIRPIKKELDAGHKMGLLKKVDLTLFGYLLMGLVEYGFYYSINEGEPPCNSLFHIMMEFVMSGLKA